MEDYGGLKAKRMTGGRLDIIYLRFPGVSTAITAVPKEQLEDNEEAYACVSEMVLMLFNQLPEEQQGKLLTMCNDLFPQ